MQSLRRPARFARLLPSLFPWLLSIAAACTTRPVSEPPDASAPEPATEPAPEGLDDLRLLGLLDELASDELGGRYTLHDDIRRAAASITSRYRAAGVVPGAPDGFEVDFEVMLGVDPGPGSTLTIDGEAIPPGAFVPLPSGSAGRAEGPLVSVGFGIVLGEDAPIPFDELAGVPLAGAVAVVMTAAPPAARQGDPKAHPQFGRGDRRLGAKLERLAEAGAVGVIVVDGDGLAEDRTSSLPDPSEDRPVRTQVGIPVVQLAAEQARARWPKLLEIREGIRETGRPQSRVLAGRAEVRADVTPRIASAPNVVAMVPGTDLADEIVLVGAHYDHIGTDAPGHGHCRTKPVEAGEPDRVCNGADDNASGSAIVAELAMAMTAASAPPRRTMVFVHFAGEELGLLGSRALAARLDEQPPFAGRRVVAMLNIDMVGRLRERLTVSGVGSSEHWMEILDAVGPRDMRVLYDRPLTTRSDHAPFYERGVPALFFFTELHDDYHAPGDESDGIVRQGVLSVARLVAAVAETLAEGHPIPFAVLDDPAEGLVRALPGGDPSTVVKEVGPTMKAAP